MVALLPLLLFSATQDSVDTTAMEQARQTLLAYIEPYDATADASRWQFAWADVNGDGLKDALAFSRDGDWCGMGGCTLLVLEAISEEDQKELGPFTVAAEIAMADAPIRFLPSESKGWADLIVTDEEGQSVRLSFDGESYPFSPADGVVTMVNSGIVLFARSD